MVMMVLCFCTIFKVIFNTRNNMGNLRKLHREALVPLVPYTGIFLSDLVSIEEGMYVAYFLMDFQSYF